MAEGPDSILPGPASFHITGDVRKKAKEVAVVYIHYCWAGLSLKQINDQQRKSIWMDGWMDG